MPVFILAVFCHYRHRNWTANLCPRTNCCWKTEERMMKDRIYVKRQGFFRFWKISMVGKNKKLISGEGWVPFIKKDHLNFFFILSFVFNQDMLLISVNTLVCTFLPRSIKKWIKGGTQQYLFFKPVISDFDFIKILNLNIYGSSRCTTIAIILASFTLKMRKLICSENNLVSLYQTV